MKKPLAVAVILLFIGVAFAPSINANISKASVESELVEFTTEVYGLDYGKQTVKLTLGEAKEVEALFDSIRDRLNATESREEAEEIFKEAVVELDKYGLLGGLSIKHAQRLVLGEDYEFKDSNNSILSKISKNNDLKNYLCLTAGYIDIANIDWYFSWLLALGVILTDISFLSLLLAFALVASLILAPLALIALLVAVLSYALGGLALFAGGFTPLVFMNAFSVYDRYEETNQWLWTNGELGVKNIQGRMSGTLFGFTGINFVPITSDRMFILGHTISINLSAVS